MDEREKQAYLAKLAEQAERYDEMVEAMKKVARLDVELTAEERNLLSVGYKNVIEAKRASWRILSSIEQNDEAKGNEHNVRRIKDYIKRVEDDLAKICNEILSIIAIHLLPSSTAGESIVFFYKMKGDYYRYLAEFKTKNERKEAADQSLKAYQAATSTAMMDLPPTHSIRLGLALNLSVFYYEILNSPERACHLAKQAFDEAIAELNTLSAESYKESTLIMQLLKDNLTLWTSDLPEESAKLNSDVASPLIVRTPKPRRHHRLLPSPHRLNVVAPPRERCCLRPSPRLGNVVPRRPNASVSPATIHNLRRASEQQPKATDMITDS